MNKLKTLEGKMEKVHQKFAAFKSEMETVNRLLQAEEKEPIKIKTFEEYMKD
jgi:phage-related tail protein